MMNPLNLPALDLPTPVSGVVLAAAGLAGLVLVTATAYALGRSRTPTAATGGAGAGVWERHAEIVLTVAAAGIATAVAVNGMWQVFGDVLGFTGIGRIALAGFLEIALVVSAIRARRALREHATVGVDGAAVWALALLSAVLAASDATGLGRAVRFAAPLVAAWLWERGLAAERRRAHHRPPAVIAWRWTRERLAVRLGLAEPVHRATSDLDRTRRLAALTRARLRLAVLETSHHPRPLAVLTGLSARRAWALWRLQRHALAAVEHLHLGTDPTIPATIQTTVAAVVGLRDATTPTALTTASPWTPTPVPTRALSARAETETGTEPIRPPTSRSDRIEPDRIEPAGGPATARTARPNRSGGRVDDITARRARAVWDRAQDHADHGTGAPLTGTELATLLGVTDGAARKIAARWRAERAASAPPTEHATS